MRDVLGYVLAGLQILIIVGGLFGVWVRLSMRVKALAGEQDRLEKRCDGIEGRCNGIEEDCKDCKEKQDGRYEAILVALGDIKGGIKVTRQRVEDLIDLNGGRPRREGD